MNDPPESNAGIGPTARTQPERERRPNRLLLKLTFSLLVALIALKIGDLLLGQIRETSQRHWLRLNPNVSKRHQSTEFDYVFHTNSLGFRGPDVPFGRSDETKRIVVIGDSFVAGVGVADEAVFTGKLQQQLREQQSTVDVVNLGRSGSSTIRELDIYRRFGRKFRPQIVVLIFFIGNDLAEIHEEMTAEELARWKPAGLVRASAYTMFPNLYLELAMIRQLSGAETFSEPELQALVRREASRRDREPQWAADRLGMIPQEVQTATRDGRFPVVRLLHACLDPDRHVRSLDPGDDDFETAWPRVRDHLDQLRDAVRKDNAELRIVVLPESVQVDSAAVDFNRKLGFVVKDEWLTGGCRTEDALSEWTRENQVAYLNLTDAFRASSQQLYHVWDSHLNADGHALMARALFDWLQPSWE